MYTGSAGVGVADNAGFSPRGRRRPAAMNDTASAPKPPLPDRLSVEPRSPHYHADVVEHDIGIRFNGKERHDVEEYCLSEGWIKVPAGRTVDRRGKAVLITLKGRVEVFYRDA